MAISVALGLTVALRRAAGEAPVGIEDRAHRRDPELSRCGDEPGVSPGTLRHYKDTPTLRVCHAYL